MAICEVDESGCMQSELAELPSDLPLCVDGREGAAVKKSKGEKPFGLPLAIVRG